MKAKKVVLTVAAMCLLVLMLWWFGVSRHGWLAAQCEGPPASQAYIECELRHAPQAPASLHDGKVISEQNGKPLRYVADSAGDRRTPINLGYRPGSFFPVPTPKALSLILKPDGTVAGPWTVRIRNLREEQTGVHDSVADVLAIGPFEFCDWQWRELEPGSRGVVVLQYQDVVTSLDLPGETGEISMTLRVGVESTAKSMQRAVAMYGVELKGYHPWNGTWTPDDEPAYEQHVRDMLELALADVHFEPDDIDEIGLYDDPQYVAFQKLQQQVHDAVEEPMEDEGFELPKGLFYVTGLSIGDFDYSPHRSRQVPSIQSVVDACEPRAL